MSTTVNSTRPLALRVDADHWSGGPGQNPTHASRVKNIVLTSSVTKGDNLPYWREKIANHISATTTLVGNTCERLDWTQGVMENWTGGAGSYIFQLTYGDLLMNYFGPFTASNSISVLADRRASSKFLSHYIASQNTWRGGNFLAEVRETYHMLASPVKSLYQATWDFAGTIKKIGRVSRKRKQYGKDVANAWLAYKFGVKPTLNDLSDAQKAYDGLFDRETDPADYYTVSGFGKEQIDSRYPLVLNQVVAGMTGYAFSAVDYESQLNTVRYKACFQSKPPGMKKALQHIGADDFDIIPAAWEAIPFSWLIDYFANVGEVLDGMRLWQVSPRWVNRTVRNSYLYTIRDAHLTSAQLALHYQLREAPSAVGRARYIYRDAPSSVPYPTFHFQCPGLLSTKWLNIAAVTRQVASSRPVRPDLSGKGGVGYHIYF